MFSRGGKLKLIYVQILSLWAKPEQKKQVKQSPTLFLWDFCNSRVGKRIVAAADTGQSFFSTEVYTTEDHLQQPLAFPGRPHAPARIWKWEKWGRHGSATKTAKKFSRVSAVLGHKAIQVKGYHHHVKKKTLTAVVKVLFSSEAISYTFSYVSLMLLLSVCYCHLSFLSCQQATY